MMKSYKKTVFFLFLMISLSLVLLSGCQMVEKIDSLNGILEKPAPDPEIALIAQAETAFFAGDYTKAEELLQDIFENSEHSVFRNHALYGLACISIVEAEDTDGFKDAVRMLDQWEEPSAEIKGFSENPEMLVSALNKQISLLECAPEIRYVTSKKDGAIVKKQQEEIRELQSTIKKLQHQISVLETIDQEIQEKRKPI